MTRAAIVGISEFGPRKAPGRSALQIKVTSAYDALTDAGLSLADVDAVLDSGELGPLAGYEVCEYLGIQPSTLDTVDLGGASFEFLASHAVAMISAGKVKVALVTYGSTARTGGASFGERGSGVVSPASSMEIPWGMSTAARYAVVAARHMAQFGTTVDELAEIAVVSRAHALRNPDAVRGLADLGIDAISLNREDVVRAPRIAEPLGRLDCCLVSDGGGAIVIVAEEIARDLRHRPIWIVGCGEAIGYPENKKDITTWAAVQSARHAFGEASVTPSQIDVAMLYDSFTITVLVLLEDLGFCGKGEGGEYVSGGKLRFDSAGGPAINTDGGGLSSNHPGRRGIFLLIEAVRQLRGSSTAQVVGARIAVAQGLGGFLGTRHSATTVVLANE